ncbi:uncharacterized protein CANTADRAFT_19430 [Suhomyces tanzawaensis NRRL Y-17324]|uniref:Uncharacterized protein n=1 Tax=Suhomyces tanzawaensis NRRL Y-17324 TaxID=984487 RepID=A0A1E4SQP5_9ASCO|nr:uncharacterized protein CANTADRAFT_19430 [Suhomyces tanzawaensis NRRL Y-17324]ODV81821.1 hypothetical protein CANTADRAFT_19430 [Suhomyces tanzawaensis NRRL Y-17324]
MPPKLSRKDAPEVTILKFKRQKTTYALPITGTLSLEELKSSLTTAINSSGGLNINDNEPANEDDIVVPKSELVDEDDIPVPKSEYLEEDASNIEENDSNSVTVTSSSIRLAVPKDKTQPYENQWIQLTDGLVEDLKFGDYDILAFAYEQEEFYITEAIYED